MLKINEIKLVFVLTGTINTNDIQFNQLTNPDIRKSQYLDAINYYLTTYSAPVVFVENSNTDISPHFEGISKTRLEIITFEGNHYPPSKGKGYGEMEILNYAIKHSSLLKEATHVVKVTGRYKVLNMDKYLNYVHSFKELIDIHVDLSRSLTYSDSRFFIVGKSFFDDLFLYHEQLDDSNGFYMEHAICKAALDGILKGRHYRPFKYYPVYSGFEGATNRKCKTNFLYIFPRRVKFLLKYWLLIR